MNLQFKNEFGYPPQKNSLVNVTINKAVLNILGKEELLKIIEVRF